jgi:Ran GTPase-activating protein (RanGAP) involved in mRNA processing and transport
MERLKNGIYATAMDMRIKNAYEEMEDEDLAEIMLIEWLANGVPDGNDLSDNINDFGDKQDFDELVKTYFDICEEYRLKKGYFVEEVEEIKKNIVEMLDNPYYFVI